MSKHFPRRIAGLTILQTERRRQQAAERHMEGLPPKP